MFNGFLLLLKLIQKYIGIEKSIVQEPVLKSSIVLVLALKIFKQCPANVDDLSSLFCLKCLPLFHY